MSARSTRRLTTADYDEMMRLRASGMSLADIARQFDVSEVKFLTVHDPGPHPGPHFSTRAVGRFRSADEERAFRRFPIDRHKPGGYE